MSQKDSDYTPHSNRKMAMIDVTELLDVNEKIDDIGSYLQTQKTDIDALHKRLDSFADFQNKKDEAITEILTRIETFLTHVVDVVSKSQKPNPHLEAVLKELETVLKEL